MFQALDEADLNVVIDAMELKEYNDGDFVIQQGADGDYLYVVDNGNLECTKAFNKAEPENRTFLCNYGSGQAFGELALLYNAPRAASIQAKSSAQLFALNRETFNHVVKDAAMKKRNRYEEFLNKIPLLDTMEEYERGKIADVIRTKQFKQGDYVIREGEKGNTFYFIEKGHAIATKTVRGTGPDGRETSEEQQVFQYGENTYFGELALLKDQPRAANVIATTDLTVVYLDRGSFMRLLGPLEEILKRNMSRYE